LLVGDACGGIFRAGISLIIFTAGTGELRLNGLLRVFTDLSCVCPAIDNIN